MASPPAFEQPRDIWTSPNKIHTNHGICADSLHKWGRTHSTRRECGADKLTIHHMVMECLSIAYGDGTQFWTDRRNGVRKVKWPGCSEQCACASQDRVTWYDNHDLGNGWSPPPSRNLSSKVSGQRLPGPLRSAVYPRTSASVDLYGYLTPVLQSRPVLQECGVRDHGLCSVVRVQR
ncbi:hypothetical protein J6590_034551 [Homalodisca vitripennis]|nr:hypothetical protein J6590_034551 [Homalodisca vitripennis]